MAVAAAAGPTLVFYSAPMRKKANEMKGKDN